MQIVLNVSNDGSSFFTSFQDVINSLSQEEKKEIAKDILMQWLKDPHTIELQTAHREALKFARENASSWDKDKDDEYFKTSYRYNEYIRNFKSSKVQMIEKITSEAVEHFKTLVSEKVRTDENLANAYNIVQKELEKGFPGLVQNAMSNFFVEMFTHRIPNIELTANNADMSTRNIVERLNQVG